MIIDNTEPLLWNLSRSRSADVQRNYSEWHIRSKIGFGEHKLSLYV